jgi:hypothetical protein
MRVQYDDSLIAIYSSNIAYYRSIVIVSQYCTYSSTQYWIPYNQYYIQYWCWTHYQYYIYQYDIRRARVCTLLPDVFGLCIFYYRLKMNTPHPPTPRPWCGGFAADAQDGFIEQLPRGNSNGSGNGNGNGSGSGSDSGNGNGSGSDSFNAARLTYFVASFCYQRNTSSGGSEATFANVQLREYRIGVEPRLAWRSLRNFFKGRGKGSDVGSNNNSSSYTYHTHHQNQKKNKNQKKKPPKLVSEGLICAVRVHLANETEMDALCPQVSEPLARRVFFIHIYGVLFSCTRYNDTWKTEADSDS